MIPLHTQKPPEEKNLCPGCRGQTCLYDKGTVSSPGAYFQHSASYAIAADGGEDRLPIFRCPSCGHGFSPLDCDANVIAEWYSRSTVDITYLSDREARSRTAQHVLQRLEHLHPPKGNLLDIGASMGIFLFEASQRGWNASGIEPSTSAVQFAKNSLGLQNVQQGDLRLLATLPEESFEVVTAFDVIEHLVDPAILLRESKRLLRPGGILALTTPRFDSFLARIMGKRWYCIFPAHLHYFSRQSLYRLLQNQGFSVLMERSHTRHLSLGYLWQRLWGKPLHAPLIVPINFGDEFEIYARKEIR